MKHRASNSRRYRLFPVEYGDRRRTRERASVQGVGEDTGWLITLSDLTLLLLCFLGLWYVRYLPREVLAQSVNPIAPAAQEYLENEPTITTSADNLDWSALKGEIKDFIADAGMTNDVSIEMAQDEILLAFKDSVPFASGKAAIRRQALPVLEKVAAVAASRPAMRLEVNGHTDDRPISTPEFPSNWELSSARASRVARYLIEQGVDASRIEVQGFAYHRPRVPNENFVGRQANRRVEIRLLRSRDSAPAQGPDVRER